ncbi:DUF4038 domain-containing protein [Caldilinea sp.]|uniref:apiosidase-like domain-containing protein n=1 Tax=Caldilinea sp. TaxID=2293560 RepID=UPI002B5D1F8C|nr:DUF4038 domain-containing protein [Anaerolineales bacterium]HQY90169.1 DUF4038 domain-containing protein [Caldilinea sp.]HRA65181.1 DUF4038 domain-containing protein [Caldilinea sp.]
MHDSIHPWQATELTFTAVQRYDNPYTDVELFVQFRHESGVELVRPAFWDGGNTWKVRFASPLETGSWQWQSFSAPRDEGLSGQRGTLRVEAAASANRFERHGFWRILPGERNLHYADGATALLVADTAWALPWRATHEQCELYAQQRQAQGFNATLLMSVQPDRRARGPRSRTEHDGFDVGFEDLPDGHLNQINIAYFQYLDGLAGILRRHEIVPVWNPVFHGYGWKGLDVAGPVIPPVEYARYCRYLVARYGAQPAVWLVAADGDGLATGVDPGGWEIERWDAYQQPTGIHYAPHQDPWAYQDRAWLDFQWCQTGHSGEHRPQRVAVMWEQRPIKAVANGEPTYEHIGEPGRAAGWWQGHEAWSNLTAGGTMGVVYGAGSLWQWRLDAQEPHEPWCMARDAGWREALDFEGARYVGVIAKIFDGLPFAGMAPDYRHTYGRAALIAPGKLFIVYLPDGGLLQIEPVRSVDLPRRYRVIDPTTGAVLASGEGHDGIAIESGAPRVVIFADIENDVA